MTFTSYFLFILVMTHALVACSFSGPGYYGNHGKRGPAFEKTLIHKNVPEYPWTKSVTFHHKKVSTPFKSHLLINQPFLHMPPIYEHANIPFKPFVGMPTSMGKHFYDILPGGKPLNHLFNPYPLFKATSIPMSSYNSFLMGAQDSKSSGEIPKISKINLSIAKPKILFIKGIDKHFPDPNQFMAAQGHESAPNRFTAEVFPPKPNSEKDILAIDFMQAKNKTPPKDPKPVNSHDYFNVISIPIGVPSEPAGGQWNDNVIPDTPISDVGLTVDSKTQITDKPIPDFNSNALIDAHVIDINAAHPKVELLPITNDVVAPVGNTKINPEVTFADIPGFVVDGGSGHSTIPGPTHILSVTPYRDVLHINDALINLPGINEIGLNSNANNPLLAPGGISLDFSEFGGVGNLAGFGKSNDLTNGGFTGDLVITGNNDIAREESLIKDQTVIGGIAASTVQQADGVIGKVDPNGLTLNSEIIPRVVGIDNNGVISEVSTVNDGVNDVSAPEEDTNSLNAGSVLVIRPVPFLMNIEPFGPGPYGQCRVPSRVVCGVRFGWEHVTGMAEWCQSNCVVFMYSSYCDDDRCQCECT